jgi:hypothetical protein
MKAVQERNDADLREMKAEIRAKRGTFEILQGDSSPGWISTKVGQRPCNKNRTSI